jgi:hypothetical protein
MKSKNLMAVAAIMSLSLAHANTEEQVLNSAPINVDGYLQKDSTVSDAELESLKSTVNKYKTDNQLYKEKTKVLNKVTSEAEKIGESAEEKIMAQVEAKKAEDKALEKIKKAEAKLKCLIDGGNPENCNPNSVQFTGAPAQLTEAPVQQVVEVQQAAPIISTTEAAPIAAVGNPFEVIKLLPYAGATTFNGKVESLETELTAGLRLESNITTRFSMGVGFNYNSLKTNDFANGSSYMTPNYFNQYGNSGREIQYRSMGLDIYGKFFVTQGERFRPYVGAGLGYNRSTMKYNDNNPWIDSLNRFYGSEEYNTSFVTGQLLLGSEIMITPSFGLNIEGQYATGLGDSMSSKSAKNGGSSPDQQRLRDLGDEIINSNMLSIFLGGVVKF